MFLACTSEAFTLAAFFFVNTQQVEWSECLLCLSAPVLRQLKDAGARPWIIDSLPDVPYGRTGSKLRFITGLVTVHVPIYCGSTKFL